jgi:DNA mismatch repair ATPase MutS
MPKLQKFLRIGLKLVGQKLFLVSTLRRSSNLFRNENSKRNLLELNVIEHMLRSFGISLSDILAYASEISEKYELFRDVVQNLGVLDCLLSLAAVASLPGYVKPEFVDSGGIEVAAARHPMVEQILVDAFVPNDIKLKVQSSSVKLMVARGDESDDPYRTEYGII